MTNIVADCCASWGIGSSIVEILKEDRIEEFFPVQEAVIPFLMRMNSYNSIRSRDLCVSAPTGSGKVTRLSTHHISIITMYECFADFLLRHPDRPALIDE